MTKVIFTFFCQALSLNCRPFSASFSFRSINFDTVKIVDNSGIKTWIVRVEGDHADHFTTMARGIVIYTMNGWGKYMISTLSDASFEEVIFEAFRQIKLT